MAHRTARLTVFGRQLLVARVEAGWPVAHVAEQLGHQPGDGVQVDPAASSRRAAGLEDRSSRPTPLAAPAEPGRRGRDPRRPGRPGDMAPIDSGRSSGRPPSTVHRVLRPAWPEPAARRRPGDDGPGPLCRLPPGCARPPGPQEAGPDPRRRRLAGARPRRTPRPRERGVGYEHLEVVVDDASRLAVVVPVPDEIGSVGGPRPRDRGGRVRQGSASRIERVLTDNGWAYTHSTAYRAVLDRLGARHKRTRPWRPQTNGKAERFIQTLINEWAYARPYALECRAIAAPPGLRRLLQSTADPTPRSADAHPSTLSTTSMETTTSRYRGSGFGPVAVTSRCGTQSSTWRNPSSKRAPSSSTEARSERR